MIVKCFSIISIACVASNLDKGTWNRSEEFQIREKDKADQRLVSFHGFS
jgi:hypothetical protein